MGMKEKQRTAYKSMAGKEVDMHKLVMQNEMTVAIGNVRVNARGDELGAGGKIVKKREDVLREAQNSVPTQTVERKNIDDMDPEGNE